MTNLSQPGEEFDNDLPDDPFVGLEGDALEIAKLRAEVARLEGWNQELHRISDEAIAICETAEDQAKADAQAEMAKLRRENAELMREVERLRAEVSRLKGD